MMRKVANYSDSDDNSDTYEQKNILLQNKQRQGESQVVIEDIKSAKSIISSCEVESFDIKESSFMVQLNKDSSENIVLFLGSSHNIKAQCIGYIVKEFNRTQNLGCIDFITHVDNNFLINYPIIEDLDVLQQLNQWNKVVSIIQEKKIILTLILNEELLVKPIDQLYKYLEAEFIVLMSSVSDFNLLLESNSLKVIVSGLINRLQRNNQNSLTEQGIKLINENIFNIYWNQRKYVLSNNEDFRSFLYFLIDVFSSNSQIYVKPQTNKYCSNMMIMEQLLSNQNVYESDITVKPPQIVAEKLQKDSINQIIDLTYDDLQLLPSLFQDLTSKVDQKTLQQVYDRKVELLKTYLSERISQLEQESKQGYILVLSDMKAYQRFEGDMLNFNLKKTAGIKDQTNLIKEVIENNISLLDLEEDIQISLDILKNYSEWNDQFKMLEADFKQQIGTRLSDLLRDIFNDSNHDNTSFLMKGITKILNLLGQQEQSEIKEFLPSSVTSDIINSVEFGHSQCTTYFKNHIRALQQNKPNFKKIEQDLNIAINLILVLENLNKIDHMYWQILSFSISDKLNQCKKLYEDLKSILAKNKNDLCINEKLSRIYYSEKEKFKAVYSLVGISSEVDDRAVQQFLMKQISKYEKDLMEIISKKEFGEQFLIQFKQLENIETLINPNIKGSKRIQNNFEMYLSNFIELYKKKSQLDLTVQMSLLTEKNRLNNLNNSTTSKPKFISDLLCKITQLK